MPRNVVIAPRTALRFRPRRLKTRTLDERIAVRFPRLLALAAMRVARLRPGTPVRRYLFARRTMQGYQAVNRGDLDLLLAVYHEDAVICFDPSSGFLPPDLTGEHHGHDGLRRLWEAWRSPWEELELRPEELIDLGERFLVQVRMIGRGLHSGVATEKRYFEVYTLRDGRISRHDNFVDRERALEAVGLSE
jgi:ketosteroid isomerase-like protein